MYHLHAILVLLDGLKFLKSWTGNYTRNVDVLFSLVGLTLGKLPESIAFEQKINVSRKSQIALEYCYRHKSRHPSAHVFWIDASSAAKIQECCRDISQQLGLKSPANSARDSIHNILEWLREDKSGQWLVILDDAQNTDIDITGDHDVSEASPSRQQSCATPCCEHGSTVVTSRNKQNAQALGINDEPIIIPPLVVDNIQDLVRHNASLGSRKEC